MMDPEIAAWIASFFIDARAELAQCPGVTIEAEDRTGCWVQIILEPDEQEDLARYTLNFPYRGYRDDPVATLNRVVRPTPPGTQTVDFEPDGFATVSFRPEIPPLALALYVGEILALLLGADNGESLLVEVSTQNC